MSARGLLLLGTAVLAAVRVLAFEVDRVFVPERFSRGDTNVRALQPIDSAAWIWAARRDASECCGTPEFVRFECAFDAVPSEPLRLDVTADERYVLFLDGREISRGPHRGMPIHWYYQSYRITGLSEGRHLLAAVCWKIGSRAPISQLSWKSGFALATDGPYDGLLSTGRAKWKVARLGNTRMTGLGKSETYGAGSECEIVSTDFVHEIPPPECFVAPVVVRTPIEFSATGIRREGWHCYPTALPDMLSVKRRPGSFKGGTDASSLLSGGAYRVPERTKVRILWDLGDYYCAYPGLAVSGGRGSRIRWGWTEALRDANGRKGNRDDHIGKCATQAMVDVFLPDGREDANFTTPWWRCGRWCEVCIETCDEPLTIKDISICETRYPLEDESVFECDDPSFADLRRICVRGMQMCSHETSMDCPYYEQQMYPGDSRIQFLTMGTMSSDARLVRQNVSIFDWARRSDGMIAMNFPTRAEQESATYSLCWLAMLGDCLWERDCSAWLRERIPGMRHTLAAFELREDVDGLLRDLPGWSFVDWTGWKMGVPPGADVGQGVSSIVNLYYLLALRGCADVEGFFGESGLAKRLRDKGDRIGRCIMERCWDEGRGMIADTPDRTSFCEHAQCLGILTGVLAGERAQRALKGLLRGDAPHFARTTVYFSHYLFEAFLKLGRTDLFLPRMSLWRDYLTMGLKTPLEMPGEDARSDCHAWGAHPLYHLQRGVAGIRSAEPCFRSVRVAPCPGPLKRIHAKAPHPKGFIEVNLRFSDEGTASGFVSLPPSVGGEFFWKGEQLMLDPGFNEVSCKGVGERR